MYTQQLCRIFIVMPRINNDSFSNVKKGKERKKRLLVVLLTLLNDFYVDLFPLDDINRDTVRSQKMMTLNLLKDSLAE